MLGLVLCGGQSTRMSTDKGMLQSSGQPTNWAQTALNKLEVLSLASVISINTSQYNSYHSFFPKEKLVTDNSLFKISGPLLGVFSVHAQYPNEDLFLLACDMPLMEPFIMKELLDLHFQKKEKEAFVFSVKQEMEPLCGIYTAKGLTNILAMYHSGNLKKNSMKFILEQLSTQQVSVPIAHEIYFKNFNTHSMLNG